MKHLAFTANLGKNACSISVISRTFSKGCPSKGAIMRKRETAYISALLALVSFGLFGIAGHVEAMEIAAELKVSVTISLSDPDAVGKILLHFSNHDDAVELVKTSSTVFTFDGAASGDHPFVSHPDDWDNLYLALSNELKQADITNIYIKYSIVSYWDGDSYANVDRSFENVDWAKASAGRDLSRTEKENIAILDLTSEVQYSRRKRVAEVMGITKFSQNKVDAHYRSLPRIIKSAVNDIGQSGLEKYSGNNGMRNKRDENGCDEFCGWHYIYTNFDDAFDVLCVGCCTSDEGNEVTLDECCPGNPNCMEARCFAIDSSARPSEYICDDSVFPHHGFKQKGRVAKVTWVMNNGNRTEIDKILVVKKDVGTNSDYTTWETKDVEYQPKVGDLLFKHKATAEKNGGSHIMIMLYDLSDPASRQINLSGTSFENVLIMEGSGFIDARPREISNINMKDSNGEFWYDLYVIEMK
jgi:hypothetical protein